MGKVVTFKRGFLFLLAALCAPVLWAEDVSTSTETPSVAFTGETKTAPAPQAMTDRAGAPAFVTLTRSTLTPDELPSSVDAVRPEDFRPFDAQNAGDALLHQASIQTLPIGQLGSPLFARLRGGTPNETLVLIDGRLVTGAALGAADLTEIPVEQIDHIEILRGGASALYGSNPIGGVINVITKRATYSGLPTSHVGYESAGLGRQIYRLDFGSRQGPVDYFFFGNQQWESGWRDNSDARTYNMGGNAGVSLGKGGKVLVDLASYHRNAGVPGEFSPVVDFNAREVTDTQYARASYLLPLPKDSLMALRVFGSQREAAFTDPDHLVSTDRHEQSKGGETQFNLPLGFVVGGSFVHDREDHTDQITSTNTYVRSVENWSFFAEEELKYYNRLTVIPSGRFDHNSQAGDSKNPRVQTMLDALSWLRFSASAARSFRVPTIDEIQTNPTLQPEHAWTYDAGFEIHPASTSFRATYFRANVTDLIETTTGTLPSASNIGTARRQGAEIQIRHIVNEYFRDTWNYTYLENVGILPGSTRYAPLANSPRHTANFIATLTPATRWTIDTTLRYLGSRFSDSNDPSGSTLGSIVMWDFRVAYQWRQMELYFGVKNLTDRRYEEQSGFPLPGRTAYGGIQLRLWG